MSRKSGYAFGIEWTNTLGKRVFYPEKTFWYRKSAGKFAKKLKAQRLARGTLMRKIKIIPIFTEVR